MIRTGQETRLGQQGRCKRTGNGQHNDRPLLSTWNRSYPVHFYRHSRKKRSVDLGKALMPAPRMAQLARTARR